jgi:hypothetical protein
MFIEEKGLTIDPSGFEASVMRRIGKIGLMKG